MARNLHLPDRNGDPGNGETITVDGPVVIVGANGSGKTRLGSWIESNAPATLFVHRVGAQRVLNLPEVAPIRTLDRAEKAHYFGYDNEGGAIGHKIGQRWNNHPETHLLSDYDSLLSILFARHSQRNSDYTRRAQEVGQFEPVPDSPIETIVKIWPTVMPQREIAFEDGKVFAMAGGADRYHAMGMSDGERVTLYLLAQCLTAPKGSIVIVDEPELHLHRSLMFSLWDKIEEYNLDKLFVYITHDLDFAASRIGAKKLWIKSYKAENQWFWNDVPELDHLPADLMMEILGSRKKVLFTESELGSYDDILYRIAYPDHHVIPRGGCYKVIESTKAIRDTPNLTYISASGLIDRDYRPPEEIEALEAKGITFLDVAEIENVFCIEPIIRAVASNQGLNPDEVVKQVTDFILGELKNQVELQIFRHAEKEIRFRLGSYSAYFKSKNGLQTGVEILVGLTDVSAIYDSSQRVYWDALNNWDYEQCLRIFNQKGLPSLIAKFFGLQPGKYTELVLRLVKGEKKQEIIGPLQQFLPKFP